VTHTATSSFSSADPAHQASAPGAQPRDRIPQRDGFSRIPPFNGDEDFGLDTGKDVTDRRAAGLLLRGMGRCTEHCPAANTGKILNPKEIVLGCHYLNEFGAGTEERSMGKPHIAEEARFNALRAAPANSNVPVGIQHHADDRGPAARRSQHRQVGDDYGTKPFPKSGRNGNAHGVRASERQKFIEKRVAALRWHAGVLPVAGCMGRERSAGPAKIVTALARVMRHAGRDVRRVAQRKMHGRSARRLGNDGVHAGWRRRISNRFSGQCEEDVSICPHCVRTISTDWREAGATFEIEHQQRVAGAVAAHDRGHERAEREVSITTRATWGRYPE